MPRGQPRVVLFVEPVLRTAVVVSLQLARSRSTCSVRFCNSYVGTNDQTTPMRKTKLEFHQDKIPAKNLSAKQQELSITKNGHKIIRKERLNQCFFIKPRRSSLYSLSMAQANTLIFISIGDTKDIFCFILQSVDSVQELVCFLPSF